MTVSCDSPKESVMGHMFLAAEVQIFSTPTSVNDLVAKLRMRAREDEEKIFSLLDLHFQYPSKYPFSLRSFREIVLGTSNLARINLTNHNVLLSISCSQTH